MDQSTRVVGLDAQGNMVFTVVSPVMGIFQVASEQGGSVTQAENKLVLPQEHDQGLLDQNQVELRTVQPHIQPQMQVSAPVQTEEVHQNKDPLPNTSANPEFTSQMPFAVVSSLLDPNMKGSKARKCSAEMAEVTDLY